MGTPLPATGRQKWMGLLNSNLYPLPPVIVIEYFGTLEAMKS